MITASERVAARRNVKEAANAATRKRTIAHLPKAPHGVSAAGRSRVHEATEELARIRAWLVDLRLVPRIMAHEIGMSPLLTLTALLIGVKLMGPLGGLLAVPVAAVLQVIAYEVVREIGPEPMPREPPVRRDRVRARPLRGLIRLGHP